MAKTITNPEMRACPAAELSTELRKGVLTPHSRVSQEHGFDCSLRRRKQVEC